MPMLAEPSTSVVADASEQRQIGSVSDAMVGSQSPNGMGVNDTRSSQTELEELKVCDNVLKRVKDIEIMLVAEVAKHWRTNEAKRENFEKVARQVTQAGMVCVLD
ncbi:hypothetical protein Aduo_003773 [Ancylostoma duodenale]